MVAVFMNFVVSNFLMNIQPPLKKTEICCFRMIVFLTVKIFQTTNELSQSYYFSCHIYQSICLQLLILVVCWMAYSSILFPGCQDSRKRLHLREGLAGQVSENWHSISGVMAHLPQICVLKLCRFALRRNGVKELPHLKEN